MATMAGVPNVGTWGTRTCSRGRRGQSGVDGLGERVRVIRGQLSSRIGLARPRRVGWRQSRIQPKHPLPISQLS